MVCIWYIFINTLTSGIAFSHLQIRYKLHECVKTIMHTYVRSYMYTFQSLRKYVCRIPIRQLGLLGYIPVSYYIASTYIKLKSHLSTFLSCHTGNSVEVSTDFSYSWNDSHTHISLMATANLLWWVSASCCLTLIHNNVIFDFNCMPFS